MVDRFLAKYYCGLELSVWPYGHYKFVARAKIVDAFGYIITYLDTKNENKFFKSYVEALEYANKWAHEELDKLDKEEENNKEK